MSEHSEQVLVFKWADLMAGTYPALRLLYAVPNAGKRSPRQGKWMKDEGLRAGVPDIVLPVPRCGFHGLWIEMKRIKLRQTKTKGVREDRTKPTRSQIGWHIRLRGQGHAVEICWTAEEAQDVIERYLEGEYAPAEPPPAP